jgi:hypothetical protein
MAPERRVRPVRRQLDELELVRDVELAGEIGEEDDARLERRDQDELALVVVVRDLVCQLGDACGDLLRREVAVADLRVCGQLASSSRYRCASRSTSRL